MANKVIVDMNDPNRPRFTVAELKEILCERNELKARVSDLTDELALYRPSQKHSKYEMLLLKAKSKKLRSRSTCFYL